MSLQMRVAKADFRGDPGLFGFLGKAAKKIGGAILGATPIGAAVGAGVKIARTALDRGGSPSSRPGLGFNLPAGAAPRSFATPGAAPPAFATAAAGTQLACPSGFHANKSDYFTKAEGFIAAGTKCVRNRRRNPLNPGAASKAISRISAAKRATKALGRVTIRKSCD